MLKEIKNGNTVKIEGILSEIDLQKGSFKKNGNTVNSIGGKISVRVNQTLPNGEVQELEIPVHMFASELTNKGTSNPAYESISRVMNEFNSIAAVGIEQADRIRITSGSIKMNEYYNQFGKLISFPRIEASFITKIKKEDCKPEATFSVIFVVGNKGLEVDKDGVEIPDRYKISAILPQYGGKVDVLDFYATSKGVIDAVSNYWNKRDTVKANGRLNFSSRTETVLEEVDFGEPIEKQRTINISELVITGGSSTQNEGEFAYDISDIQEAIKEREVRLAELEEKAKNKGKAGSAPIDPLDKLGF